MRPTSLVSLTFAIVLSGCSVFFGNIRPAEEKSTNYSVPDLSRSPGSWKKLESKPGSVSRAENSSNSAVDVGGADVTFESKKTSAMISVNSACKTHRPERERDLHELTGELFFGLSEIAIQNQQSTVVSGIPGLQTIVSGQLNEEPVRIKTVVLKQNSCVYDLLYVSRPEFFSAHEADFDTFVSRFQLK